MTRQRDARTLGARGSLHMPVRIRRLLCTHSQCPLSCVTQLGQQDVDAFIKNLVENGEPLKKVAGLGGKSLSAMGGAKSMLGAPAGVEENNFDGQRGFGGADLSQFE